MSDNEGGTGEATQRCSPQPNPLHIPLHSHTALDYANKAPVSQNKMVACNIYLLKTQQGTGFSTNYWLHQLNAVELLPVF